MSESTTKREKKTRKSAVRSSAGCITCKVRHIKCGEQKPSCFNCLKSSRQCDGYSMGGRRMGQDLVKIVHWRPNAIALHKMSVDLAGEEEERRAFHFFRSNSVMALQGYFDSDFWSQLVLQASHTEPTIRHAVIALGSLHETTQTKHSAISKSGKAYNKFALQQCNKAIASLTRELGAKGQRSIEVLLMSCVLFVCFETLQGNYESALTHMESGVRMYHNWQAESKNSERCMYGRPHSVDKEIAQIFSRLNLQVLMFPDTHLVGKDFYNPNVNTVIDSPPTSFSCLKEAKDRLDNCISYIFQRLIAAYFARQDLLNKTQKRSPEFQTYANLLSQWSILFSAFTKSSRTRLGPADQQRARVLEIQYKAATILFDTGMSPQETAFDAFNSEFNNIVTLTSSLVDERNNTEVSGRTGHFTFDMALVAPLYLTATRCRDPLIRRRALSILSAISRQECIWNSDMLAKIAERLISIEEDGIGQVISSEDIPLTSRLSVLNATIYSEQRCVVVELCRPKGVGNGNGELDLLDEWITY